MLEFWIIIILMIGLVLAIAIGQKPISDENVEMFDRHTTNALKGASILLVFIHHWGQLTSEAYYDHSFVGYLAVTVFLFIAGYVTQFQYQKRGGVYVSWHFITGKLQRIYLPYVLVVIFFAVIGRHEIGATVKSIFNITENWFLTAILVYYLFFFVINNIIPENKFRIKMVAWCICIILYSVVCGVLSDTSVWYNTAWAFPIGIISANKNLQAWLTRKSILIISILAFAISFVLGLFRIHYAVMCVISSICLSVILYAWGKKFKVQNKLLEQIGMVSWEFYLIHVNVLYIVLNKANNNMLVLIISLIASVFGSYLYHSVFKKCSNLITGNKVV